MAAAYEPVPTVPLRAGDDRLGACQASQQTARRQAASSSGRRRPSGPIELPPPGESHLASLVRAIVYQQLAGAAAAAIHGRLLAALGGEVTAERLRSLSPETMRSVGLSGAEAAS